MGCILRPIRAIYQTFRQLTAPCFTRSFQLTRHSCPISCEFHNTRSAAPSANAHPTETAQQHPSICISNEEMCSRSGKFSKTKSGQKIFNIHCACGDFWIFRQVSEDLFKVNLFRIRSLFCVSETIICFIDKKKREKNHVTYLTKYVVMFWICLLKTIENIFQGPALG